MSIISGCPWKPRIFPGTTVTQLGEAVSCTFHLFPILSFLIFQIQVDIFMSYFRSLIYFIISMLWIELYPHKIHRLNPNPQSGSLWGQSWREIIKVKWGHKGGVIIQWHWRLHKRGRERERDFSLPVLTLMSTVKWRQPAKAREEASEWSLAYLHLDFGLQSPERWEISFCCSSHPICSTGYGSLRWLIQLPLPYFPSP